MPEEASPWIPRQFRLSNHALMRMRERGIPLRIAGIILQAGNYTKQRAGRYRLYQLPSNVANYPELAPYATVALAVDASEFLVLTAYWTHRPASAKDSKRRSART